MPEIENEFWQPKGRCFKRESRFHRLSTERRICLVLLCLFTLIWCFYLGVAIAGASAPAWEGYQVTGEDFMPFNPQDLIENLDHDGVQIILMVGCDKRPDDIGRTDTIMLAFIQPQTGEAKVLSIPRDTYVTIPGGGKTKINHAYSFGGMPLTTATIESVFGIKVDNYVEVDFNGFAALVDALGGVTLDIPQKMVNPLEGINLAAGDNQRLDGARALQFVRFREPLQADIGRINRQQQFIKAVINEVTTPGVILKIPKLVDVAMNNIKTDLNTKELLSLANLVLRADISSLELMVTPGDGKYINKVSYWVMDEDQKENLIRYLMGEDFPDETKNHTGCV